MCRGAGRCDSWNIAYSESGVSVLALSWCNYTSTFTNFIGIRLLLGVSICFEFMFALSRRR